MINIAKHRIGILSKHIRVNSTSSKLTKEDIRKHNTIDDCWVIINNKIYDVTNFIGDHPGGARALLKVGGKDATEEFEMLHPSNTLEKYKDEIQYIGEYKS
tara:strand:+ start:169 stop:471 length:303 start_codon:yes stop_codon:yes gene_type:complete